MPVAGSVIGNSNSPASLRIQVGSMHVGHNNVAQADEEVDASIVSGKNLWGLIEKFVSFLKIFRNMLVHLVDVNRGDQGICVHDIDEDVIEVDPIFE